MNWSKAPFKEDVEVDPRLMYPLSKKMMEDVIETYKVNYGLDIVTLRFFNVFGPRQDIHRKSPPLINYITRCFDDGIEATISAIESITKNNFNQQTIDSIYQVIEDRQSDVKAI
jgi:nucleoside-diphosphate-sugar epimerase